MDTGNDWETKMKEKRRIANEKLKTLRTIEDFNTFSKEIRENDMDLYTKRRNTYCFDFEAEGDIPHVHYLIDDGVSRGRCRIKYLYRYLVVR